MRVSAGPRKAEVEKDALFEIINKELGAIASINCMTVCFATLFFNEPSLDNSTRLCSSAIYHNI